MELNRKIVHHLFKDEDFIKTLVQDFGDEEVSMIYNYLHIGLSEYSSMVNDEELFELCSLSELFDYWLLDEIRQSGVNVFTLDWHGASFDNGSQRSGSAAFQSRFGIVALVNSDVNTEYIEVFDRNTFFPWAIKDVKKDAITITSHVYSINDLIDITERMGMKEDSRLTINSFEIERRPRD